MLQKLENIVNSVESKLSAVNDNNGLEDARIEFLGRKGLLPALTSEMRNLTPEERPAAGKALNQAKQKINALFADAEKRLSASTTADNGPGIDVTLPGRKQNLGSKHPVTKIIDECARVFRRMGFIVADGPEIETVYNNFDALNTPKDHPSRDELDTFYFDDGRLLRTQTSPVQIRVMENNEPPIRIVAPGRCFRRDTPDATHSMNFHQIEGLYIDKDVSLADLKSVLLTFAHELFGPDVNIRLRPHFFPFTEPSVEYDFSCIMC
jgi:phenylalanyl-tRNA synthetase alpha chain